MSFYYFYRQRQPKDCWTCDGYRACRCSTVTIRAAKRGAKGRWLAETKKDLLENDDYGMYSGDVEADCDGKDCTFCDPSLLDWEAWLVAQTMYHSHLTVSIEERVAA